MCTVTSARADQAHAGPDDRARRPLCQWLRGDESNLNPKTAPNFVLNATTRYRVGAHVALFASIENLLDQKYETFGSFSPTSDVPIVEMPNASNPRSLSPAPPISVYAGVRLTL